ncbi:universal stress protein, partial [Pseudomonas aeruginosa]|uniref:universal stress protein n=1 Tax=Pseudomonas aeruginosa TaxID=287 RepID=UPI0021015F46
MFHTLLVAIDGGPQTRRIAELARQAAAPGARVHLLCAVDADALVNAGVLSAEQVQSKIDD